MKRIKNILVTALVVFTFLLPLGSMALSSGDGASAPDADAAGYVPGGVPAESMAAESMAPALHGVILAMLNHDVDRFDTEDPALVWESLYNMLSLYGQLDSRTETQGDYLTFPAETVRDYSAALVSDFQSLGPLPAALADRLTYDGGEDYYRVACGSDDLAQLQVRDQQSTREGIRLEGALVYLVDGSELVRFQAILLPRDTMFGYSITALSLTHP